MCFMGFAGCISGALNEFFYSHISVQWSHSFGKLGKPTYKSCSVIVPVTLYLFA